MAYHITLIEPDGEPFGSGLTLELLSDGTSLGRTTVDNAGVATFSIDPPAYKKLVVRLVQAEQATSA